ncbi:MAG: transglycosylase SLT domain-containing protein [Gammaproteobacteria bacterium]
MNNTETITNPPLKKDPARARKTKPKARSRGQKSRKNSKKTAPGDLKRKAILIALEALGLVFSSVSAVMIALGYGADWFSGTSFFGSLLPFAAGVLIMILAAAALFIGWWKLRKWLLYRAALLTPAIPVCCALLIAWFVIHDNFALAFVNFRTLVGGKEEAGRITIAHQVYAAYRRHPGKQLQKMLGRAETYRQDIKEAADAFDVDSQILLGIAAAESSFIPRNSRDGGRGLFQITHVPGFVMKQAQQRLSIEKLDLENPKHNAYVAAATFKHYFAEMKNDLFLALLAYNIGPANGGLRFIMQQYGASDFTTIQPYLQNLPRDYPIRVLSYSLAFRLFEKEGRLLAYEEGNNAGHIQRIGIPGLQTGF